VFKKPGEAATLVVDAEGYEAAGGLAGGFGAAAG